MKKCLVLVSLVVLSAAAWAGDRKTYRDAAGRNMGSAMTDSRGRVTYRDAQGRLTGSSTTDSSGRVTYRDAQGRLSGSKR